MWKSRQIFHECSTFLGQPSVCTVIFYSYVPIYQKARMKKEEKHLVNIFCLFSLNMSNHGVAWSFAYFLRIPKSIEITKYIHTYRNNLSILMISESRDYLRLSCSLDPAPNSKMKLQFWDFSFILSLLLQQFFLVKSQHSLLDFCHLTIVFPTWSWLLIFLWI